MKHFKCTEHWITVDTLSLKILGWVEIEQVSIKEDIAEQHDWSNVVFIDKFGVHILDSKGKQTAKEGSDSLDLN